VTSASRCQKLPPCPTEPVSAMSKIDLLLDKARLISNGVNASVITYLRGIKLL